MCSSDLRSIKSLIICVKRIISVCFNRQSLDPDDNQDDSDSEDIPTLRERHLSSSLGFRSRNSSGAVSRSRNSSGVFYRSRNSSAASDIADRRDSVEDNTEMDAFDARKQFSELTKSFRPPSEMSDKNFVGLKFNRSMSGR